MSEFDEIINRFGTNSSKHDGMSKLFKQQDLIHLGVADMDFKSPKPIINELIKAANFGVFGYVDCSDEYYESFIKWMRTHTKADIKKEQILYCPRINIAAGLCAQICCNEQRAGLINTPAYMPLVDAVRKNGFKLIEDELILENNTYKLDLDALENKLKSGVGMMILINPHNPTTKVFSQYEVEQIARLCAQHEVVLFVDEIHAHLCKQGVEFYSALNLPSELRQHVIIATSAAKTFNIPGLIASHLVIFNEQLKSAMAAQIDRVGMHNPNVFALAAIKAAFSGECDEWLKQVRAYIDDNEALVSKALSELGANVIKREGTYLLWCDFRHLKMSDAELKDFFASAGVGVYTGSDFGTCGFVRLNLATSKHLLNRAMQQIQMAFNKRYAKQ